jgi:LacI family transcriptional regulator
MPRTITSITINEIARIAGVAKGTVSKVLNNYHGINERTRQRVLKIVKDLNYEPNSAAQTLALRRTGNIGLIIPHSPEHSLTGAYWSSLVSAITREATRLGYSLALLLPQAEGLLPDLFRSIVRKKRVDGLIVGAELMDKGYFATLLSTEAHFVMLGRNPDFIHHCVDIDNRAAGASIASYLIGRGYRRPLFIGGPSEYYYMADRAAGFAERVRAAGLEPLQALFLPYEDRETMKSVLTGVVESGGPDSAVVGAGGDFMFDALAAFEALGLRPPEFGFATFDDYRFLDFLKPPITAVAQPVSRMGKEAVRILVELLKSPREPAGRDRCVILDTSIIGRASCGETYPVSAAQKDRDFFAFQRDQKATRRRGQT